MQSLVSAPPLLATGDVLGPGFALTFDDDYIAEWADLRPLFNEFGARATFFICGFRNLSAEQRRLLATMQDEGHEIGCHSVRHLSVTKDFGGAVESLPSYLEEEIVPAIDEMRAAGFRVNSFAYPFGHHGPAFDSALLRYFNHVRATTRQRRFRPTQWNQRLFHRPGSRERIHYGLGIDESYGVSDSVLQAVLARAARARRIAVMYAHKPGTGEKYMISKERLRTLFRMAAALGLKSYVMRELT